MKKILIAYLWCTVLLVVVFTIHYADQLGKLLDLLGTDTGIMWTSEVLSRIFFPLLLAFFVLQTLLILIGYLGVYALSKKRTWYNSKTLLLLFLGVSFLAAGLLLGLFEPILATDYFEYGIRQELNKAFEFVGYTRINVTVYIYLTLTVLLTWFFVRKETNKTKTKVADPADTTELLDH